MFGWDRNPLRRRVDRVEAGLLAALIIVFLIVTPMLVAVAGHWAHGEDVRALRAEATWSQVSATVQQAAPVRSYLPSGPQILVWSQGRWTAPDGQPRSGLIPVSPAARVGSTARIWVTRSGSPTGTAPGRSRLLGWTPIAEVGTALVLVSMCVLTVYLEQWLFGRSLLANWGRAWRAEGRRNIPDG